MEPAGIPVRSAAPHHVFRALSSARVLLSPPSRARRSLRDRPLPPRARSLPPAGWPRPSPSRFSWPPAPAPPPRSRRRRSPSTSGRRRGRPAPSSSRCTASATPAISPSRTPPAPGPAAASPSTPPTSAASAATPSRQRLARHRRARRRRRAAARGSAPRHPGLPLVVVGHSMGGGVALAAAARGLDADAPCPRRPRHRRRRRAEPPLPRRRLDAAAAAPEKRWTGSGLVSIRPTDNPAAIARVVADPRHFGDPSSRELYGLVRLMDDAAAAAPSRHAPDPRPSWAPATRSSAPPSVRRRSPTRIPGGAASSSTRAAGTGSSADLQAPRVWHDVADFALSAGPRR